MQLLTTVIKMYTSYNCVCLLFVLGLVQELLEDGMNWYGFITTQGEGEAIVEHQLPHITGPREGRELGVAEEKPNWREERGRERGEGGKDEEGGREGERGGREGRSEGGRGGGREGGEEEGGREGREGGRREGGSEGL